MWGQGAPIMTHQNFRICQKPNPRLFTFDGQMVNYKLWRNRIKDHLCNRSTRRYESLLDNIEKSKVEIVKESLHKSTVDGVNAWEVAEELEGFIFDFVNQDLYERRGQFTNYEAGNGFEAWRQINLEFVGGGAIANVEVSAGSRTFLDAKTSRSWDSTLPTGRNWFQGMAKTS